MGDDSETTVIEENEGTDDGLSEEEPIQEEQIASQPPVSYTHLSIGFLGGNIKDGTYFRIIFRILAGNV